MKMAYSEEPGLIIKCKIPLKSQSVMYLAAKTIEFPEHRLEIQGEWLVMYGLS